MSNINELNAIMMKWAEPKDELAVVREAETSNIVFMQDSVEMLKVAEDGFYVRGVKVPADDKEAEIVYNAFKAFLMWAELHRN